MEVNVKVTIKRGRPETQLERRTSPRIVRGSDIETSRIEYPMGSSSVVTGRMSNLSSGGVQFSCQQEYAPDTLLQMSMTLPGWTRHHPGFIRVYENSIGRPFTAVGRVLRCDRTAEGFSVATKFVNVDPDDLQGLSKYLQKTCATAQDQN
jgi:hypothetical protein